MKCWNPQVYLSGTVGQEVAQKSLGSILSWAGSHWEGVCPGVGTKIRGLRNEVYLIKFRQN